ncbi:Protein of unknown function [Lactobacillus gigeriorum DSM 23908 = CRBIP 24.85]|uniref:Uncharacterized protein n=2 Tax=Lactobacillus gigeriorum DSM 23908 = CRBIP 24.85 TaxID=1423751 RepID=I7LFU3_9LACO|nr:Protein of unknown function [Lactobacillus gigeriorum DSM 23908 = CRBIP 24.85]
MIVMSVESIFYNGLEFTNETFNAKKLKDTNTDITVAIISFNQQQIDTTFDNIDKKRGIDDFYTKSKYKPNEIKYFTSFVNSLGVKFGLVIVPSWNSYRLGVAEYSSLVFDAIGGN